MITHQYIFRTHFSYFIMSRNVDAHTHFRYNYLENCQMNFDENNKSSLEDVMLHDVLELI